MLDDTIMVRKMIVLLKNKSTFGSTQRKRKETFENKKIIKNKMYITSCFLTLYST
jgi:hypothetical protein